MQPSPPPPSSLSSLMLPTTTTITTGAMVKNLHGKVCVPKFNGGAYKLFHFDRFSGGPEFLLCCCFRRVYFLMTVMFMFIAPLTSFPVHLLLCGLLGILSVHHIKKRYSCMTHKYANTTPM
jgi:hypothetical protein